MRASKLSLVMAVAVARAAFAQSADSFEVASIRPTAPDWTRGRFIRMQGAQFVARNHTVKTLIAAAYNLSPRVISGGPEWVESYHFDIFAKPPGTARPNIDQQNAMLRILLDTRFKLKFHRETKEMSIYALTVTKGGPKLKEGSDPPEGPLPLMFVLDPGRVTLPGRNATMGELASVMQRAALDHPVVDKTELAGRYNFDLAFTPSEAQFGGIAPPENADSANPDLFTAIQQQLGLRLQATRGPVEGLVIDGVERPTEN